MTANFSSPDEVFADIDRKLRAGAESLADTTASYLFELSGPGGGSFQIIVSEGHGTAGAGDLENPDLTFGVSAEDLMAITRGDLDGALAFMSGKITMQGNQRLALALAPLLLADFDWHWSQNDVPDDLDPDSRSSRHIVSVALPPGGPLSRPVAVKGKAKPEEQKSKMSYLSRSALSEKGCCPFRD